MVDVINLASCTDWGKPGDVRIDRTTKWGNPFRMKSENDRALVCRKYAYWIQSEIAAGHRNINELADAKRLGCWCAPKQCHGDYLKSLIEALPQNRRKINK